MIFDSLDNASTYRGISRRLARALAFLQTPGNLALPSGRHAIDGDDVFALIQRYTTKPPTEGFWEAHRRYVDVQFIVGGVERMRYAPLETLTASGPYDAEKDFATYTGDGQDVIVRANQFAIFFPHDGHMPQLCVAEPSAVHKIVLKVAVA